MTARKASPANSARPPKAQPRQAKAQAKALTAADIPLLEWIAAGVGLILTVLVIGMVAWEAMDADKSPPTMRVTLQMVTPAAGGYVAQIELTNRSGEPAAQVAVEGVLTSPGADPEVSDVTFDYVPDHSSRKGGLFFKNDPRTGVLALRAKGFVEP